MRPCAFCLKRYQRMEICNFPKILSGTKPMILFLVNRHTAVRLKPF